MDESPSYQLTCPACKRTFHLSGSAFTAAYHQARIQNVGRTAAGVTTGELYFWTDCPVCSSPHDLAAACSSNSTLLPMVAPAPDAPADVLALFQTLHPGSVAVAYQRDNAGPVLVYYEGGIYSRPAAQPPTLVEQREYAVNAAGRAIKHYPTRAFFALPNWGVLNVVGFVDTERWWVWWEPQTASARLWRTLVRVERSDEEHLYVVVPGWQPDQTVTLARTAVPGAVLEQLAVGHIRFYAHVNIGAERSADLVFTQWETT